MRPGFEHTPLFTKRLSASSERNVLMIQEILAGVLATRINTTCLKLCFQLYKPINLNRNEIKFNLAM